MKILLSVFILCICSFSGFGQAGYPEPEKTDIRLFYIQHSNNHNTYVYDVNLNGNTISKLQPIDEYRIVYTENAIKKPLTGLQEKMAYGMTLINIQPNLLTFQLAATKNLNFYLTGTNRYRIYVTVNNQKMYLNKLFVNLKDSFLGSSIQVESVLFYGTDFSSGKSVVEKFIMK